MSSVEYEVDGRIYEGWYVRPEAGTDLPLIVIAHAWGGLGENEKQKASLITREFGYAAFAMDVYGKGQRGNSPEECQSLMNPLVSDRAELQKRLAGSLAAARTQPGINPSKVAAIGFCFGGLSVLDMARANQPVLGVASFHGLLGGAPNIPNPKPNARILIEHGWLDPMATPDDVVSIARELEGADWQLHAHGKALHSFTTHGANNPAMGTVYDSDADRRSFAYLKTFLAELFN